MRFFGGLFTEFRERHVSSVVFFENGGEFADQTDAILPAGRTDGAGVHVRLRKHAGHVRQQIHAVLDCLRQIGLD